MLYQVNAAFVAGSAWYLRRQDVSLANIAEGSTGNEVLAGLAGASALFIGASFLEQLAYPNHTGPLARSMDFLARCFGHESSRKIVVNDWIEEYNTLHKSADASVRNSAYAKLVNSYYELATTFYEWGWGASFHFAYRLPFESFAESIRRHELYLAGFLQLKPGSKVQMRCSDTVWPWCWTYIVDRAGPRHRLRHWRAVQKYCALYGYLHFQI